MKKKVYVKARIIPIRKTKEEWEKENPILLEGEHGFVTDGKNGECEKIGDGVTPWNGLGWWKGLSAYEIAVKNGFNGTEDQWLESLKGDAGKDAVIEQSYSPASENAQSGKSVAQAMSTRIPKPTHSDIHMLSVITVNRNDFHHSEADDPHDYLNDTAFGSNFIDDGGANPKHLVKESKGLIPQRDSKGNLWTGDPVDDEDCANKKYVDNKIANINTNGSPIDLTEYVKKKDVAAVATTGDYNDLKNIPESVQVDTDLTVKDNNNGLPTPILFDGNTPKQTLYWNGKKADKFYEDTDGATADNPIIINTAEELAYVVSATYENTYSKHFKFADSIEKIVLQSETYGKDIVLLNSAEAVKNYFIDIIDTKKAASTLFPWVCQAYDETKMCFGGHFDGNGVEIYGMYASDQTVTNSGIPDFNMAGALFGIIDSAVISNVVIKNSYANLGTGSENWQFGLIAAFAKDKDTTMGDNITYINHCIVANNYIYKRVNENGFNHSGVVLGGNTAGNYIIQNCLVYGNMAKGYYSGEYNLPLIGKTRNGLIAPNEFAKAYPDWVFNDGTNDLVKTVLENSIILGTPPYAYSGNSNNATLRVLTCDEDINCLKNVYVDWGLNQILSSSYPTTNQTPMFSPSYFLNQTGSGVITEAQLSGDKAVSNAPNLAWGIQWFVPKTYKGNSIPFDFLQFSQHTLLSFINNNKNLLNTLGEKTDSKCITSKHVATNRKEYLDFNSLYILVSNSGNADIKLYDSSTNAVVTDGDGSTLPDASTCILVMPKNILDGGDKVMCYFIGFTGSFSLTNLEVLKSRHFYLAYNQQIYCKPTMKNLSVFKIGL